MRRSLFAGLCLLLIGAAWCPAKEPTAPVPPAPTAAATPARLESRDRIVWLFFSASTWAQVPVDEETRKALRDIREDMNVALIEAEHQVRAEAGLQSLKVLSERQNSIINLLSFACLRDVYPSFAGPGDDAQGGPENVPPVARTRDASHEPGSAMFYRSNGLPGYWYGLQMQHVQQALKLSATQIADLRELALGFYDAQIRDWQLYDPKIVRELPDDQRAEKTRAISLRWRRRAADVHKAVGALLTEEQLKKWFDASTSSMKARALDLPRMPEYLADIKLTRERFREPLTDRDAREGPLTDIQEKQLAEIKARMQQEIAARSAKIQIEAAEAARRKLTADQVAKLERLAAAAFGSQEQ